MFSSRKSVLIRMIFSFTRFCCYYAIWSTAQITSSDGESLLMYIKYHFERKKKQCISVVLFLDSTFICIFQFNCSRFICELRLRLIVWNVCCSSYFGELVDKKKLKLIIPVYHFQIHCLRIRYFCANQKVKLTDVSLRWVLYNKYHHVNEFPLEHRHS